MKNELCVNEDDNWQVTVMQRKPCACACYRDIWGRVIAPLTRSLGVKMDSSYQL